MCPQPRCPVPAALTGLIEAPVVSRKMIADAYDASCATGGGTVRRVSVLPLTSQSKTRQRLMQSAYQAMKGFADSRSIGGWCSVRESVRLAASERGTAEAVACCVEIAGLCGLAV